jgi:hypothetical protein
MPGRYNVFVHLENIKNFEKKLETEKDSANREILMRLLAEAKAGRFSAPSSES